MACPVCRGHLVEVNLAEALQLSDRQALQRHITGEQKRQLPDAYQQYHVRSYLKDRSLFLDYNLNKFRLKHGRRLKRFFISPITWASIFNLPWLIFNIIATNIFHLTHTEYCERCQAKYVKGAHPRAECDYHIEYYKILDDILSGMIVHRKDIYQNYAAEQIRQGYPSAYRDLFQRPLRWEGFWDLISIGMSLAFWLYLLAFVAYPFAQVLAQRLESMESLELVLCILRRPL